VVPNSIDTAGDRDFVASFLYTAALAMTHLSRLAEDVILFTSEEFGFFELDDAVATGSSLMPQKKNPDPLELVRGKSGRAIGALTGWLVAMKGTPLGYNKDFQEDKAAVFESGDTLAACTAVTAAVVRSLTPRYQRMRDAASGLLLATEVADYLVARGVPFRTAHEITGRIVRDLDARGGDFSTLAIADWQRYDPRFEADVVRAITPDAAVRARRTPQSTHPDEVGRALADTRAWLASWTGSLAMMADQRRLT
jgi:argininosuccinate lyase